MALIVIRKNKTALLYNEQELFSDNKIKSFKNDFGLLCIIYEIIIGQIIFFEKALINQLCNNNDNTLYFSLTNINKISDKNVGNKLI